MHWVDSFKNFLSVVHTDASLLSQSSQTIPLVADLLAPEMQIILVYLMLFWYKLTNWSHLMIAHCRFFNGIHFSNDITFCRKWPALEIGAKNGSHFDQWLDFGMVRTMAIAIAIVVSSFLLTTLSKTARLYKRASMYVTVRMVWTGLLVRLSLFAVMIVDKSQLICFRVSKRPCYPLLIPNKSLTPEIMTYMCANLSE